MPELKIIWYKSYKTYWGGWIPVTNDNNYRHVTEQGPANRPFACESNVKLNRALRFEFESNLYFNEY